MAFSYDKLEPLDPNETLKPGDRIVLRFNWLQIGYYSRAAQWAVIEIALENRTDFVVVSYVNNELFLDVEIEVLSETMDAPGSSGRWGWGFLQPKSFVVTVPVAICVVAICAVLYKLCSYLTYRYASKIVSEGPVAPEMKALVGGIGAVGYAVLIGVVYVVLKGTRIIK